MIKNSFVICTLFILLVVSTGCGDISYLIKEQKEKHQLRKRLDKIASIDTSDPDNIAILINMLGEPGGYDAGKKLAKFGGQAIPAITEAMDDDAKLRNLLIALRDMGPKLRDVPLNPDLAEKLVDILSNHEVNIYTREIVSLIISYFGPSMSEYAVPVYINEISIIDSPSARGYIIDLGKMGTSAVKDAVGVLFECLNAESNYKRDAAVDVLTEYAGEIDDIIPCLQRISEQTDQLMGSVSAVEVLNKLGLKSDKDLALALINTIERYSRSSPYTESDFSERFPYIWYVKENILPIVCKLCQLTKLDEEIYSDVVIQFTDADDTFKQLFVLGLQRCE